MLLRLREPEARPEIFAAPFKPHGLLLPESPSPETIASPTDHRPDLG